MRSQRALAATCDEEDNMTVDIKSASSLFIAGRMALLVIVAFNIIVECDGKDQKSKAVALVASKGDELPIVLEERLEKVGKTSAVASSEDLALMDCEK